MTLAHHPLVQQARGLMSPRPDPMIRILLDEQLAAREDLAKDLLQQQEEASVRSIAAEADELAQQLVMAEAAQTTALKRATEVAKQQTANAIPAAEELAGVFKGSEGAVEDRGLYSQGIPIAAGLAGGWAGSGAGALAGLAGLELRSPRQPFTLRDLADLPGSLWWSMGAGPTMARNATQSLQPAVRTAGWVGGGLGAALGAYGAYRAGNHLVDKVREEGAKTSNVRDARVVGIAAPTGASQDVYLENTAPTGFDRAARGIIGGGLGGALGLAGGGALALLKKNPRYLLAAAGGAGLGALGGVLNPMSIREGYDLQTGQEVPEETERRAHRLYRMLGPEASPTGHATAVLPDGSLAWASKQSSNNQALAQMGLSSLSMRDQLSDLEIQEWKDARRMARRTQEGVAMPVEDISQYRILEGRGVGNSDDPAQFVDYPHSTFVLQKLAPKTDRRLTGVARETPGMLLGGAAGALAGALGGSRIGKTGVGALMGGGLGSAVGALAGRLSGGISTTPYAAVAPIREGEIRYRLSPNDYFAFARYNRAVEAGEAGFQDLVGRDGTFETVGLPPEGMVDRSGETIQRLQGIFGSAKQSSGSPFPAQYRFAGPDGETYTSEYETGIDDSRRREYLAEHGNKGRGLQGAGIGAAAVGSLAGAYGLLAGKALPRNIGTLGAAAGTLAAGVGAGMNFLAQRRAPEPEPFTRLTATDAPDQEVAQDALDLAQGRISPTLFELRHGYVPFPTDASSLGKTSAAGRSLGRALAAIPY